VLTGIAIQSAPHVLVSSLYGDASRLIAARLLFLTQPNHASAEADDESQQPVASPMTLIHESIEAAMRSIELQTANREYRLSHLIARWELLHHQSETDDSGNDDATAHQQAFQQVYDDIKASVDESLPRTANVEQRKHQIRVGQHLLTMLNDEKTFETVLADINFAVSSLREAYRDAERPMTETHCMQARNLVFTANRLWTAGQKNKALMSLSHAEQFFERGLVPVPNNRTWRKELIQTEMLLSAWNSKLGMPQVGKQKIDEAIRNSIQILESDPSDYEARKLVVRCLIRFGDLSVVLGESSEVYRGYYTAAQDCRLLFKSGPEDSKWALSVRIWAVAHAFANTDESTRAQMKPQEVKSCERFARDHGVDTTGIIDVLEGRTMVARPDGI
jgi:hypothetical protein